MKNIRDKHTSLIVLNIPLNCFSIYWVILLIFYMEIFLKNIF